MKKSTVLIIVSVTGLMVFILFHKFNAWISDLIVQPQNQTLVSGIPIGSPDSINVPPEVLAQAPSGTTLDTFLLSNSLYIDPRKEMLARSPRDRAEACLPLLWHINDLQWDYRGSHGHYSAKISELLKPLDFKYLSTIVKNGILNQTCGEMLLERNGKSNFLLKGFPPKRPDEPACIITMVVNQVKFNSACGVDADQDEPDVAPRQLLDRVDALAQQEINLRGNTRNSWRGPSDDQEFWACHKALGGINTAEELFMTTNDQYTDSLEKLIAMNPGWKSYESTINQETLSRFCKNIQLIASKDTFVLSGETQTQAFCRLIYSAGRFCHEGNCGFSTRSSKCSLDSVLSSEGLKGNTPSIAHHDTCGLQMVSAERSQQIFYQRNHRFSDSFPELEEFRNAIRRESIFLASQVEKHCENTQIFLNKKMVLMTTKPRAYPGCTYISLISRNKPFRNKPELHGELYHSAIHANDGNCDGRWGQRAIHLPLLIKVFQTLEK